MQSPILRPFPAKFTPAARSPLRRLHPLRPRWRLDHRPPPLAASASGDIDAFTKYSGYLFEGGDSLEVEFPREYDLRAIAAIYRRKPFLVLRRSLQIGSSFGRWLAVRYLDSVLERSDEMFKTRATELRMILLELGPAFVKIAQAVSSRPDVIPPAYLDELSLLQDRIAPFPTVVAFSMIEKELGQPIDILFSDISPEPIAAASLGQVLNDYIIYASTKKSISSQTTGYWESRCCQSSETRSSSSNFFRYIYPTLYCRGGKKNCQVEYRSSGCN